MANGVGIELVGNVEVECHHGKVVPAYNGVNVEHFTLGAVWDLHTWLSIFLSESFLLNFQEAKLLIQIPTDLTECILYLENLGSNNAEGGITEAEVEGWHDILHEEPVSHSLVILTKVPENVKEIVKETP